MTAMSQTIGFIGLGIMGRPIAHNLLNVGFSLLVWKRHQEDERISRSWSECYCPTPTTRYCGVL